MEPKEQLRVLKSIWGSQEGYVFLPYIPQHLARGPERKRSLRNGPAFRTGQWDEMLRHLSQHRNDELYFAPMVFSGPRRQSHLATKSRRLWADLDEVDPHTIPDDLTPNILWETSPGRYAAVWFMDRRRPETTERGGENHKLTIALGADPSGWDTTQLLRVPGSANNKPGYPEGIRGRLISYERGSHSWDTVDELPEVPETEVAGGDLIDEQLLDSVDRFEVWTRLRRRVPGQLRQMMRLKEADDTMDRSSIAWQIERSLADAGATLLEMVAIMRPTPWNKFEGRADELKRLTLECGKALALRSITPQEEELEDDTQDRKIDLVPVYRNVEFLTAPEPTWLFDQFIPTQGCGFISGIPKSMKSWLALDMGICAALGIPYLGYVIERPVNVLYIQQEDPTSLVNARLNTIATSKDSKWALSTDVSKNLRWPAELFPAVYTGFQGNDESWRDWLDEKVEQHDIELVIFDTLATIASGTDPDSGIAIKGELLDPIKQIARKQHCAMCFVHHNTKSQGNERAGQNMAGSGQIHAWADFGLYVHQKTDDNIISFTHETKYTGTNHLKYKIEGLEEDPQRYEPVEWVGILPKANATAGQRRGGNPSSNDLEGAQAPASVRVKQYIRTNPDSTVKEVATACGVAERTVRKVRGLRPGPEGRT